jgi:arylsulfatase A-like enzyme
LWCTIDTLIFLTGDNGRPDDTCDSLLYENGFTGSNGPFAGEWLKNNGGGSTGKASTWEGGVSNFRPNFSVPNLAGHSKSFACCLLVLSNSDFIAPNLPQHREVGVFRWLGHIRPGVTDVLGSTLDITPSVLHLAGIALPTDRTFDGM